MSFQTLHVHIRQCISERARSLRHRSTSLNHGLLLWRTNRIVHIRPALSLLFSCREFAKFGPFAVYRAVTSVARIESALVAIKKFFSAHP